MAERESWFLAGEGLVTAGLCAAGFLAGGALGVLALRVGSTLAADLAQGGRDTLKARWLSPVGALNHDIARALAEALKRARVQTAQDVRKTERFIQLQRTDREAAKALAENVEALGAEAQRLVEDAQWLAELQNRDDLARLMAGEERALWASLDDLPAQAWRDLEDELAAFVQARLLRNWMAQFEEILKETGERGTKAWRACQRLWQGSLSAGLAQVQADAAATRETAEWLRAWAERLESLPVSVREETGREALEQALRPVLDWLEQMAEGQKEILEHTRLIPGMDQKVDVIQQAVTAGWAREPDAETVAAAQELAGRMPLKVAPAVGDLPAGSSMPFKANPLFVGREAELAGLAQRLAAGKTPAVTGIGGVGKTQLAAEFVHRYGQYFAGGVFWLSMASAEGVPAEVARRGERMAGLPAAYASLSLVDQVRLVEAAWAQAMPRLLVFDNCEDAALLRRWRPTSGGGRVLLTCRRAAWSAGLGVSTLALHTLPRQKSVELLRKFRPELGQDDANLHAIAEELGDLPLALHLAGSWLAVNRHVMGAGAYLAKLRAAGVLGHGSMEAGDDSPTEHVLNVGRTFALSYEQLDGGEATDGLAKRLLACAACFALGEAMPRAMLRACVAGEDETSPEGAEAHLEADAALRRLIELGLVEEGAGGEATLHRLAARFVERADGKGMPDALKVVEHTLQRAAYRVNNAGRPRELLAWQSHLRHVTERAMQRTDAQAASLCNSLGYHLQGVAAYGEARPYYERALAINEEVLGPQHPTTATSLNNLGALLQAMGQLAAARPYFERALAIYEEALGPQHPDTATSLNNLGGLLQAMGQLAEARPYYARALAILEAVLGPDHPTTQIARRNLARLDEELGE